MIKRDRCGIVVQHSNLDPNYGDGGDSARSTGILALCGDVDDAWNLCKFIDLTKPNEGILMRHPFQPPWNNPNNFTRDQLICWMAGTRNCFPASNYASDVFKGCIKRGFRAQNTEKDVPGSTKRFPDGPDILSPADMWFLATCANASANTRCLLAIVGLPWFILSLLIATCINPGGEQNQIICQCLTFGKTFTCLYAKLHPDYKKAVREYWGGWRDQAEIGEMLITKVESVIK